MNFWLDVILLPHTNASNDTFISHNTANTKQTENMLLQFFESYGSKAYKIKKIAYSILKTAININHF